MWTWQIIEVLPSMKYYYFNNIILYYSIILGILPNVHLTVIQSEDIIQINNLIVYGDNVFNIK